MVNQVDLVASLVAPRRVRALTGFPLVFGDALLLVDELASLVVRMAALERGHRNLVFLFGLGYHGHHLFFQVEELGQIREADRVLGGLQALRRELVSPRFLY